jgi:type I restriction enzyme S subunit
MSFLKFYQMSNQVLEEKIFSIDKSKWKLTKLGTLAEDISIRVDKPANSEFDKFVGLDNFVSGDLKIRSWSSTKNLTSSAKAFKSGDILFARRNAYLRRASLVDFDGCCSGDAFVIRENLEKVIPGFITFLMNSNSLWDYANANAAGTMSKRVKWRDLAEYEFLMPPKNEQSRLTELLWAMDEVIEKENVVLMKLEVILDSLFQQFKTKNTQWTKIKIGDLVNFNYGKALKESDRIEGEFPVITSSGIQGTHIDYISSGPGIVVGRKGNVGQVTWVEKNFWTTDTAYYITIKNEYKLIPFKFLFYLLRAAKLEKLSISTAVPGLNRDDALMTPVYLPDNNEIKSYIKKFETVELKINNLNEKLLTSQSLQKCLINLIF